MHSIENENPYTISIEKNPAIILEFEKNYKNCRRVYQPLLVDVADTFTQYIHSLDLDEIQQLNDDLEANGWGITSLREI